MSDEVKTEDAIDEEAMAAEWAAMADGEEAVQPELDSADDGTVSERVLSQDEIDSLLGFDSSEKRSTAWWEILTNSSALSYERLPMLEVIFDRLVRLLTTSLRNFTSDNVEVSLESMTSIRFGEYLDEVPLPALLSIFKAKQWDSSALLTVDTPLIYTIVDVLLGGRRGSAPARTEGRPFTTIERTLIERLVRVVLADVSKAFAPLCEVDFMFERLETNPRFTTITRPSSACMLTKVRLEMEGRGGNFEFLIPYSTIEPVRELLLQMFLGEKFGQDSIWEQHLGSELWNTEMQLDVVMKETTISLNDALNWKPGSQIILEAKPTDPVVLRSGESIVCTAFVGQRDGKVAVQVDHNFIRPSEEA
ncbi:MAG: flagellar motor switch protein FliM [Holosporales bacterium]